MEPPAPRDGGSAGLDGGVGAGLGLLGLEAHRARALPAAGFAVLVGAVIASYSVVDARAVREVSPLPYLGTAMLLQGVLIGAMTRFDSRRIRAALRPGVLIGVGSLAGYRLVLLAFRLAPVGRVATLRETSVLPVILLSRERPGPATWAGAALCVVGAVPAAA